MCWSKAHLFLMCLHWPIQRCVNLCVFVFSGTLEDGTCPCRHLVAEYLTTSRREVWITVHTSTCSMTSFSQHSACTLNKSRSGELLSPENIYINNLHPFLYAAAGPWKHFWRNIKFTQHVTDCRPELLNRSNPQFTACHEGRRGSQSTWMWITLSAGFMEALLIYLISSVYSLML